MNETLAFQLDLPKFESLDNRVLGVSVDHIGAQQAFAEKMGLTIRSSTIFRGR